MSAYGVKYPCCQFWQEASATRRVPWEVYRAGAVRVRPVRESWPSARKRYQYVRPARSPRTST